MLAWKRGDLPGVTARLAGAFAATAAAAILYLALTDFRHALAALGLALAVWLVLGSMSELALRIGLFRGPLGQSLARARGLPRSAWAMTVAHVGLGVVILGITVSSTGKSERILVMHPGESTDIAGYTVHFDGVQNLDGPNYQAQRGTFTVTRGSAPVTTLSSEKRFYPVERMPTTEAGISSTPLRDLYAVLGDQAGEGSWTVRLYHNPLVIWIWGGGAIMALGGAISLTDRRLRVGAPRPARARLAAVTAET
jgi:cytochrome c-type biogenesis protein CcmF